MTEKERMIQTLFPSGKESAVKDVKFFPGEAREIREEDFCAQVNAALLQIRTRRKPVEVRMIDGHLPSVPLRELISS